MMDAITVDGDLLVYVIFGLGITFALGFGWTILLIRKTVKQDNKIHAENQRIIDKLNATLATYKRLYDGLNDEFKSMQDNFNTRIEETFSEIRDLLNKVAALNREAADLKEEVGEEKQKTALVVGYLASAIQSGQLSDIKNGILRLALPPDGNGHQGERAIVISSSDVLRANTSTVDVGDEDDDVAAVVLAADVESLSGSEATAKVKASEQRKSTKGSGKSSKSSKK